MFTIEPQRRTLHGHFSLDLPPVLTIDTGDTVRYRTLGASWHVFDNPDSFQRPARFLCRRPELDAGHCLCGPVAIRGAKPGMTLEVKVHSVRTGSWGWTSALASSKPENARLGMSDEARFDLGWRIDTSSDTATNQFGQTIAIHPFMGVMGMPPDEPGVHGTMPPRFCGGNLDCKALVEGSCLFLPIAVEGALFSVGDGHAVQGDGEVSGTAIECPMELVELEFVLHQDLQIQMPRAQTPDGWITFGLHDDLNEAWMIALNGMLDLMEQVAGLERRHALAMASLIVDLHVTQVVNGVKGVHAALRSDALAALCRDESNKKEVKPVIL